MIGGRLATLAHGGDHSAKQAANLRVDAQTVAEAAALVNVAPRTVKDARTVLASGDAKAISGRPAGALIVIEPRRVGVDAAEPLAGTHQRGEVCAGTCLGTCGDRADGGCVADLGYLRAELSGGQPLGGGGVKQHVGSSRREGGCFRVVLKVHI